MNVGGSALEQGVFGTVCVIHALDYGPKKSGSGVTVDRRKLGFDEVGEKGIDFDGSGHYSQELGGESGGPGAAEWVKNVADGTVRFGKGSFDELGGEGLFET